MTVIALVLIGLFAGTVGSSLGIGGGVLFVPSLVVLLGFDQHLAEGTSLAVILPTAMIGAWAHQRAGRIDWSTAIPIGAAGIAGAVIGSRVALSLQPEILSRLFAALLLIVAGRMLVRSFRHPR